MKQIIIFLLLLFPVSVMAQDFNIDDFKPIKPIVEKVENNDDSRISQLIQQIALLERKVANLNDRVSQLEKDKADMYTDLDKDSKIIEEPEIIKKMVILYTMNNCAPCKQWKDDRSGIYKKAFEARGYLVVEGLRQNAVAKSFPCFSVTIGGKTKNYIGLITPDYIERNF